MINGWMIVSFLGSFFGGLLVGTILFGIADSMKRETKSAKCRVIEIDGVLYDLKERP